MKVDKEGFLRTRSIRKNKQIEKQANNYNSNSVILSEIKLLYENCCKPKFIGKLY
ncbi:MAG: hypothetical protein LBH46_00780 [Rickettsiales bacterium]|nr:hypothetical protein [Rickettsiales bacterium]